MRQESLRHLEALAREIGAEAVADEARSLAERASEGRFYVACVGQFKRGKSTLVNALVGMDVLPSGTVPVTSVVTVVRYGDTLSVRIRHSDKSWETIEPSNLTQYVSEELNPGNSKGIQAVEVYFPGELLSSGLCFVDTPGLGSVFEANSEATTDFIPHIDAALFVFGADPPITGEEIRLAEDIAKQVESFLFVQNKADRVTDKENEEAAAFARKVLSSHLNHPVDRIYIISALEKISTEKATREWTLLENRLKQLAQESGQVLVQGAVERGVQRLSQRLLNILNEETDALMRPIEETEKRLALLHDASNEAERALWELGPLYDAELSKLGRTFTIHRTNFLKDVMPKLNEELLHDIRTKSQSIRFGPKLRDYGLHHAQEIARRAVQPWLKKSERDAKDAYLEAVNRFAGLLNNLLDRLHESDTWISIPLPECVGRDAGLRTEKSFVFNDFHNIASPAGFVPLIQWLADAILPRSFTLKSMELNALQFLQKLMEVNAMRVENSLKQRLQDSRLRMESEIRYTLREALKAAERGMENARRMRDEGKEAVGAEVQRLCRQKELLGQIVDDKMLME